MRVKALLAKNALLEALEQTREEVRLTKKALADRAGLEPSAVRKLLTSQTANPTTENVFRLMSALGMTVVAKTASGKTISLV